jgi:RNA polymerase sigma-70 factor (ECF subfamily)
MVESEEQRLIQAGQQGDAEAFNQLVRLYEARIYNLCYRMLGSADAAADAAQDTFLSAFRSLRRFRGGSFRSWLFRIATNTCYDVLRARKRRPTASLDAALDAQESSFEPPDQGESPDEFALRRELSSAIQHGLSLLPDDQRVVLILCDIHGMPYNEIAQVTGTSLGTVKSRLSRGRARLREVLRAGELLPAQYRHQDQENEAGNVDTPARSDAAGV